MEVDKTQGTLSNKDIFLELVTVLYCWWSHIPVMLDTLPKIFSNCGSCIKTVILDLLTSFLVFLKSLSLSILLCTFVKDIPMWKQTNSIVMQLNATERSLCCEKKTLNKFDLYSC